MPATGLTAAVHTGTSPTGPQPQPQGPRDPEVRTSMQEMEDRNDSLQKEAENVKEEVKNKDEEEEEDPARLCKDWTRGSVRRVTRQLEQRMKMDHETPTTSSSSPPSLSGGTSCSSSQRQAASIHPVAASQLQDASDCSQESIVSTEQEEQEEGPVKRESGDVVEMGALGNNDRSTKGHKLQPADGRLLSTSYPFNHFAQSPFASVNFLCLEGVTELESGTDWDCSPEGPHSDIIMRETWETLCELGAFLQQVSTAGAYKTSCVDQFFGLGAGSSQKRSSSIQKRVREVEARIRQAGLTPPSLMKRSASLAKLGCLELLANDLSEWEISRSSVSLLSEQHPVHTSDESKKQRVHNSPSEADRQPEVLEVDVGGLSEAGETSTGIPPPPSYQSQQRGDVGNIGPDSLHPHALSLIATRQPYGRTHPLRRLKKRTVSTLYHTM